MRITGRGCIIIKGLPFIPLFFVTLLVFALFSFCLACSPRSRVSAQQPPAQEKQVDVISAPKYPFPPLEPGAFHTPELITVDVREVAQNLDNEEMVNDAFRVLRRADNAYFSTATVNLLKEYLYNGSSESIRRNAMVLLSYSSHPDAIPILIDQLRNHPSVHFRSAAATFLGQLAGEAAIPELERALAEDRKRHKNRGLHGIVEGVQYGLGYAGGAAVPRLIKTFEDDIERHGGQGSSLWLIGNLGDTLDRRVIEPLINVISQPASPSDPMMHRVRHEAASVLYALAFKSHYERMLKHRANRFAEGIPVTPHPNKRVSKSDRIRIGQALETAGYDTFGITDTDSGVDTEASNDRNRINK